MGEPACRQCIDGRRLLGGERRARLRHQRGVVEPESVTDEQTGIELGAVETRGGGIPRQGIAARPKPTARRGDACAQAQVGRLPLHRTVARANCVSELPS